MPAATSIFPPHGPLRLLSLLSSCAALAFPPQCMIIILAMASNPTVEEILNMTNYQLKEYLEDKHVPTRKKQSKEFLQVATLQTHVELEAKAAKKRVITRRRSKREESEAASTYSVIYGRSTSAPRSSPFHDSPSPYSTSMTTSSKASAEEKIEAQSPNSKQDEAARNLPSSRQEEDFSYSSVFALLRSATPKSPSPQTALINCISSTSQIVQHLEFKTIETISFQEPLGQCMEIYKQNEASICTLGDPHGHDVVVKCAEIREAISLGTNSFLLMEYKYLAIFLTWFAVLTFMFRSGAGAVMGFLLAANGPLVVYIAISSLLPIFVQAQQPSLGGEHKSRPM